MTSNVYQAVGLGNDDWGRPGWGFLEKTGGKYTSSSHYIVRFAFDISISSQRKSPKKALGPKWR